MPNLNPRQHVTIIVTILQFAVLLVPRAAVFWRESRRAFLSAVARDIPWGD